MENPSNNKIPPNWEGTFNYIKSLSDIEDPESQDKFAKALCGGFGTDQLFTTRTGSFIGLMSVRNWETFSNRFGGDDKATKVVDLLTGLKETNETKAIRVLDLVWGGSGMGTLTSIKDIVPGLDEKNFDALIGEIDRPDSLFLSDGEMYKLNFTPTSPDATKRPTRFTVAGLYSGTAGVDEVKGDLQKSIDYCRKEYFHI